MAASLPPPRQVLAHAHWTMGNAKMSKSRGNVADPIEAMQRPGGVGVDGLRWYLMRNGGSLSNDAGMLWSVLVLRDLWDRVDAIGWTPLIVNRLLKRRTTKTIFTARYTTRKPRWPDIFAETTETLPGGGGKLPT
jgi:methionyl-tRNA synthetase